MPLCTVMTVFGTRPEAIKTAPVIHELEKNNETFRSVVCTTSQHRQMLEPMLAVFKIRPSIDLQLMRENQTLPSLTSDVMTAMSETLDRVKPNIVLVQGDTTTAAVTALAAFYQKIPVGHIEAGLRTHDIYNPFPEEVNRRLIGTVATYNFAPTEHAAQNLRNEGVPEGKIVVTGNTIVDALQSMAQACENHDLPIQPAPGRKLILVTAHRRENFGEPIINICRALKKIVDVHQDVEIVYPVHLNPNIKNAVYQHLAGVDRIHLIAPVDYLELVALMKHAFLVLTDSGGIQEEAPSFGKPVLVMRLTTERPEGVEAGVARLVGTETETIVREVTKLLTDGAAYRKMAVAINPYGDGRAAARIVGHLADALRIEREQ